MEPRWSFPPPSPRDGDLVAIGADLRIETILDAYSSGYFPMPGNGSGQIGWYSPNPRGIFPTSGAHVSRSLRRSARRFAVTVDQDFAGVLDGCGDPSRPHGWINAEMVAAYHRLHAAGWCHSVEVWHGGALAGGLFGIGIGRFFAGESMFHRVTDASKVAVVEVFRRAAALALFDVQWSTPHLSRMGVIDVARGRYLDLLTTAVGEEPEPLAFDPQASGALDQLPEHLAHLG